MRKFTYLKLIFVLFLFSSCVCQFVCDNIESDNSKDRYGAIIQMSPLWTINHRSNENDFGSTLDIFPAYNDSIFLTCYDFNNKRTFKGVNINTGEIKWKREITDYPSNAGYAYNDYWALPFAKHIDILSISTGKTFNSIEKTIEPNSPFNGLENNFYFSAKSISNSDVPAIYKAQFGSNDLKEIFIPKLDTLQNGQSISILLALPFSTQDSDYLFISYIIDGTPPDTYTCLYNQSDSSIVYNIKADVNDAPTGFRNAKIDGTDIYLLSLTHLICMDIFSHKIKWDYKAGYSSSIRFNNIYLNEQSIFITRGSYTPRTIAIDKKTGDEIWTALTENILSPYQELNGILYFVSFDYLFAIEISSGFVLWKLDAPDNSTWNFWCIAVPGVDGKKGKIIANTRSKTYCFEAYESNY